MNDPKTKGAELDAPECVKCGHYAVVNGVCIALVLISMHGTRDCGCKCVFPTSAPTTVHPTLEPEDYCPTCKTFSVLPNHCDNCGGNLAERPAEQPEGLLPPERIYVPLPWACICSTVDRPDQPQAEYVRADLVEALIRKEQDKNPRLNQSQELLCRTDRWLHGISKES